MAKKNTGHKFDNLPDHIKEYYNKRMPRKTILVDSRNLGYNIMRDAISVAVTAQTKATRSQTKAVPLSAVLIEFMNILNRYAKEMEIPDGALLNLQVNYNNNSLEYHRLETDEEYESRLCIEAAKAYKTAADKKAKAEAKEQQEKELAAFKQAHLDSYKAFVEVCSLHKMEIPTFERYLAHQLKASNKRG